MARVNGVTVLPRGLYGGQTVARTGAYKSQQAFGANDALLLILGVAVLMALVFPWRWELEEHAQVGRARESAVIGGAA